MNEVVADYPECSDPLNLDNLSTDGHFHYASTHPGRLDQVEFSFNFMARATLQGGNFVIRARP
jgi:hypothetical protein